MPSYRFKGNLYWIAATSGARCLLAYSMRAILARYRNNTLFPS